MFTELFLRVGYFLGLILPELGLTPPQTAYWRLMDLISFEANDRHSLYFIKFHHENYSETKIANFLTSNETQISGFDDKRRL